MNKKRIIGVVTIKNDVCVQSFKYQNYLPLGKPDIIVKGRNILQELDEIKHHMLLLPRDQKLEEKYPELKEAYDAYLELYRGVQIARKMMEVNE